MLPLFVYFLCLFIYVQDLYENLHAIVDTAFLLQNKIYLSIYLSIYHPSSLCRLWRERERERECVCVLQAHLLSPPAIGEEDFVLCSGYSQSSVSDSDDETQMVSSALDDLQKATGMTLGTSIPDALSKAKQSRGEKKARKV